jgi:hypothetical protein
MPVAYLELRREAQWLSMLRRFNVMLDGQRIDRIGRGAKRTYEIAPGEHELVVSIDWVSSTPVKFRVAAGQRVCYVCGHPTPTWQAALRPATLVSSIVVVPDN